MPNYVTDEFKDWYINSDIMNNRTGPWYLAIGSVKDESTLAKLEEQATCESGMLTKDKLGDDFGTVNYTLRIYTSGCYYVNSKTDEWESGVMRVRR